MLKISKIWMKRHIDDILTTYWRHIDHILTTLLNKRPINDETELYKTIEEENSKDDTTLRITSEDFIFPDGMVVTFWPFGS